MSRSSLALVSVAVAVAAMFLRTPVARAQSAPDQVQKQIDRIRSGHHSKMPPMVAETWTGKDAPSVSLTNETGYQLFFFVSGPAKRAFQISASRSETITVPPGVYEIAAKFAGSDAIPSYGNEVFDANTQYHLRFNVSKGR